MKRVWIALAAVLAVILPARLYTVMVLADARTGLYAPENDWITIAVAVAAAVGVFLLMGLSSGLAVKIPSSGLQSAGAALFAALTGLFAAGESLASIMVSPGTGSRGMEIVFSVFGLLAAAAFLAAAYAFASGSGLLRSHPLLGLLPSVWGCLGLIAMFVNYAAAVNRMENVYNTFTVALLLLFLFSQAKFTAGMEVQRSARRMMLFGPAAAALALLTAVPDCVRSFSGRAALGLFPLGLHLLNVVMAVYILVYLAAVRRQAEVSSPAGISPPADVPPPAKVLSPAEVPPPTQAAPGVGSVPGEGAAPGGSSAPGEAPDPAEKKPPDGGESGGSGPDLLQRCSEFLKNAYRASEKFAEAREAEVPAGKSGKR